MKRLAIILAFLLPMVSFAAPLTVSQRNDILKELAVLEAELQALESEMASSTAIQATTTPMVGSIEVTNMPVDPHAGMSRCDYKWYPSDKVPNCSLDFEAGG